MYPALTPNSNQISRTDVFELFIAYLERVGTHYCIVGNTAAFPKTIHSDVDMVFFGDESEEALRGLIETFANEHGLRIAQVLQHEACAYYTCLFWETASGWDSIQFDWCTDYVRNGRLIMPRSAFHSRVVKQFYGADGRYFYVPRADAGFLYYLGKRLEKRELTPTNAGYLRRLWAEDPVRAEQGFLSVWRTDDVAGMKQVLEDPEAQGASDAEQRLLRRLHEQRPRQWQRSVWDLLRRARRVLRPTGLVVAVLGPDGVGKSTVIEGIMAQVASGFRRHHYIHLRPGLGRKAARHMAPNTNPHGQEPYGPILSAAKLAYLAWDYVAGYLVKIWPAKVRSTLIVFDRYYHDLTVDPRRYRYGGPLWLARLFANIVPKPDIMLVLDAPAEIILGRKAEVSPEECHRQVTEYRNLAACHSFVVLIDASAPPDVVVRSANDAILDVMAKRTAKRFGRR